MNDDSAPDWPFIGISTDPGIVAGFGLRKDAVAAEILALLDTALAQAGLCRANVTALATVERKAQHHALRDAAVALGLPLLAVPEAALGQPVPNPSPLVARHLGLPSVAEAAALAFGPLLVEKQRSANVTCALSRYEPYAASKSSAVSAASMLSTSSAGP